MKANAIGYCIRSGFKNILHNKLFSAASTATIAACIFLYPAYRWTCHQLDDRLLAARLHIQSESPEHEAAL